jgi:hypothetical protein
MGYETTVIFVETWGTKGKVQKGNYNGFGSIIATVDLCKVCDGAMGDLIHLTEKRIVGYKEKQSDVEHYYQWHDRVFTHEGEYTSDYEELDEPTKKEWMAAYDKASKKVRNKLPYIYFRRGDKEDFEDDYGSLLKVVELDELELALKKLAAKLMLEDGWEHYRITMALDLIARLDKDKKYTKAILWGH